MSALAIRHRPGPNGLVRQTGPPDSGQSMAGMMKPSCKLALQAAAPSLELVEQDLFFARWRVRAQRGDFGLVLLQRQGGQRCFLGKRVAAMRQPARVFFLRKRGGPVARTVAEQQLVVFRIGKTEIA